MQKKELNRVAIFVYLHREGIENLIQQLIDLCDQKGITVLLDFYLQDFIFEKLG